ncbi:hypothetical protein T492DRAFT_1028447 [Pavlovales sp. CCMP2436]|nr:hypothetical protein T492DRAFT_1028447 [Pavlovales sp. CCMP2436]
MAPLRARPAAGGPLRRARALAAQDQVLALTLAARLAAHASPLDRDGRATRPHRHRRHRRCAGGAAFDRGPILFTLRIVAARGRADRRDPRPARARRGGHGGLNCHAGAADRRGALRLRRAPLGERLLHILALAGWQPHGRLPRGRGGRPAAQDEPQSAHPDLGPAQTCG